MSHSNSFRRSRGFTIIELMIVMVLMGVLASLAVPSYRSFMINQQLASASSDFLASLLQARSEAMRRGLPVSIFPNNGTSWDSGWYLSVVNNSCSLVGDSFGKRDALASTVSINTANTNNTFAHSSPFFAYSAVGFPFRCTSYTAGLLNGSLAFQAAATSRESRVVVSLSGRARICDPNREATCN